MTSKYALAITWLLLTTVQTAMAAPLNIQVSNRIQSLASEARLQPQLRLAPDNWGFEMGNLATWQQQGGPLPLPQADNPSLKESFWQHSAKPARLGGDYWYGPYPIGYKGNYWFTSFDRNSTNGNTLQGTLTSSDFNVAKRYINFLIGGGNDLARLRVELWVKLREGESSPFRKEGDYSLVLFASGSNSEIMRRENWDVGHYAGRPAHIRIVDQSNRGHINVHDFNFSDAVPQTIAVTEGGFTFHRDAHMPVWGFADIHSHPMASLGFGGAFFSGSVDGPMETALSGSKDIELHGPMGSGLGSQVGNVAIAALEGGLGHCTDGYPKFDGWPNYKSVIHQQMYIDWIRRSYDGGQRILVALAVNNELLASEFGNHRPFDDVTTVDRQIQAMKDLANSHHDWMEIAYSPEDARRIILSNKLAVVLGVEVDSLGNCRKTSDCSQAQVSDYLRHLQAIGVRQITPIHLSDNAFGAAAIYNDNFSILDHHLRNDYFSLNGGSASGVQFRLEEFSMNGELTPDLAAVTLKRALGQYAPPDYAHMFPGQGHVNSKGWTEPLGPYLLNEMMRLGMLIDLDHMSQIMTEQVLTLFEQRHYPAVSSHTGFRHLALLRGETSNIHKLPHESQKTPQQIERIHALGGIVAPIDNQFDLKTWGSDVLNDCPGSSKTWAQAYLNAVDITRGSGVAIGTDFNGLDGQPAPRFGTFACSSLKGDGGANGRERERRHDIDLQNNGVRYQTPIKDYHAYRFSEANDFAYNLEERDIWEGIAIFKSGASPTQANGEMPTETNFTMCSGARTFVQRNKITNIAKGLMARRFEELENPAIGGGDTFDEQLAAYIVKNGMGVVNSDRRIQTAYRDRERTRALVAVIQRIWDKWNSMDGRNEPLVRSTAGPSRDFDINLDGLAHYGMLPDFIQDLKNSGVSEDKLQPLLNSAEAYIQVWEKTRP